MRGLTTPGLKKVPMPGYEASQARSGDRTTEASILLGSETDLVVNNLVERTTLV